MMKKRLNIGRVDPAAYKAMDAMDSYIGTTQLSPVHQELIRIRASQMNGCTYCIDMHTRDARKNGETEQRIYALTSWRETPFFTPEERAILALTEEVTLIRGHVSDETYENATRLLGDVCTAQVIMAAIAINAWNRIGIATGMQPSLQTATADKSLAG
jgi:AhpD family alkylhydroperoxidase